MKWIIWELIMSLKYNPTGLDISTLIPHRRFLVYCTSTYWVLNPYLKGLHLTVDYWKIHHNKWVWKMKGRGLLLEVSEVELRGIE